jgi:hypothetical protein
VLAVNTTKDQIQDTETQGVASFCMRQRFFIER